MSDNEQHDMDELSFERALEELERIVAELEGGQVPLNDTLTLFERAMRLKERCTALLEGAEARIKQLVDEEGNTEPFSADAAAGAAGDETGGDERQ
ncbi:MAG TPA: exodeoxyribonuclease VII small subunit [Armatimonadota bacterium]|nr:exodeoxyribonuclease VII small subunit [Armatimonadota bacterium]